MPPSLPRVTYSNISEDFSGVHALLDELLPAVRTDVLGRARANLIGGRDDDDGAPYAVPSPIDGDWTLGCFVAASPAAVDRAVLAARGAYPGWSRLPWQERVGHLRAVADAVEARKYELSAACLFEVGKSRLEAVGEVEETIDLIRYYADEMEANGGYDRAMRRAFPHEATRSVLRPHGVFAVIAPFNFPVALSAAMIAGALLGGNTVVYKPSPMAGLTGRLLVDAFAAAGLPAGVLNLVCGGAEVGAALVDHPRIAGIAFTGSHAVGMAIVRRMAARPHAHPVIAEMGGKNPTYVAASADLDAASSGVMRSAFGLSGQKCSAGSTVFVHDAVANDFLGALVEKTARLKVGDPQERDVFVGPVINGVAAERFRRAADSVRQQGRFLLGGEILSGGLYDKGHYVAPSIAADLPADHPLHKEELFLPFLTVRRFTDLAAAIREGNDVVYGLTAGVYTRDEGELQEFLDTAEAGVLYANRASGATTGAWPGIQTFCGWKGSGVSGKGGLGPWYVPQFMREQSHTVMG
ncbi:MAG TPA: aldehyde dehydrogenase family protein [Beijerinckiaceae bacterium]|jgi:1-pyrroline-5-carboxylate dehydrogenase